MKRGEQDSRTSPLGPHPDSDAELVPTNPCALYLHARRVHNSLKYVFVSILDKDRRVALVASAAFDQLLYSDFDALILVVNGRCHIAPLTAIKTFNGCESSAQPQPQSPDCSSP